MSAQYQAGRRSRLSRCEGGGGGGGGGWVDGLTTGMVKGYLTTTYLNEIL